MLSINKDYFSTLIEILFICSIIILQFFSETISILTYFFLMIYAVSNKRNAVKSLLFSFLIALLNPGLAKISEISTILRWILLFIAAIRIFYNTFFNKFKINQWVIFYISFIIYILINSVLNSAFPIISILKVISFFTGFLTIIYGIKYTKNYNWILWIFYYFTIVIFISLFFINSNIGYLKNGYAFQGILNHPNAYAGFLALAICIYIYLLDFKSTIKDKLILLFLTILSTYLVILTKSRTGIFSVFFIILYLIVIKINQTMKGKIKISKISLYCFLLILISIYFIFFFDNIKFKIFEIIYKGNYESMLYSRKNLYNKLINIITDNPLFGNGFGVANIDYHSITLFSAPNETGNIILNLLSENGIIGLLLFVIFILTFIFQNKKKLISIDIILVLIVILLNMGEVTFFSTNGMGILMYFMFGLYNIKVKI